MKERCALPERRARRRLLGISGIIVCFVMFSTSLVEARPSPFVGLGDSIGEGVQSANACMRTQAFTYLKYIGKQIEVPFSLPWLVSSPLGVVGNTGQRTRLFPFFPGANLAVSGADVHSVIYDQADAVSRKEIDSETDLVLFPRQGSQIEIAEWLNPPFMVCWIGNNDVLSAAISFDELDASQMTPVEAFAEDFQEIAGRLIKPGKKVIFANIPDVTNIAFLVHRQDLIEFLGNDYGLEEGSFTSIVVMLLIRLGLDDGNLIQDPAFVLDATEVQLIQERLEIFNSIIEQTAEAFDMPVVDINGLFDEMAQNPPFFYGVPLTPRFLGGLFSLDGVHPSNIAHAIIANAFIEKINLHFEGSIPMISDDELGEIFLEDPFVDKDGDGVVTGRPLAGLLETLGPLLGISGDEDDLNPMHFPALDETAPGERFLEHFLSLQGRAPKVASDWSREEILETFRQIFALRQLGNTAGP